MHDLGCLVPITFAVRDAAGNLVNAATVTLTVTLPDATTVTPTVTNPPAETGIYAYDYPSVQAGRHTWRATTTGPSTSYGPVVFNVAPTGPGGIIGLDEAKQHLNMDVTATTNDDELRGFLAATTPVVEDVVGPVVARTFTEIHRGGSILVLHQCPAISVATVVPVHTGGTSYLPADLDLEPDTAIVRRLDGGTLTGPLRVTYLAGRRIVPDNIVHATKEIVRHMWSTQRAPSMNRPGLGSDDELVATGSGYLIPRRAMELLHPHRRGPLAA